MAVEHSHGGCARIVRQMVTSLRDGDTPEATGWLRWARHTQWLDWYLAHHCAGCGACDDISALDNGFCFECSKDHTLTA